MAGIVAIVPARDGSKGLPGKNVRELLGKPLLAYAIEAARESGVVDAVLVSTDGPEIARLAARWGAEVPFERPAELAADDTPMVAVIEHALRWLTAHERGPDLVVLLQPTAPLRTPEHVAAGVELLRSSGADAVASVVELPRDLCPDYVMRIEDGRLVNFLPEGAAVTRRQDVRPAFARDGTIYAFRRDAFERTGSIYGDDCRPLVLPADESANIDTLDDWERAERRLAAMRDRDGA